MSDPFLDIMKQTVENGDVPQRVTNREILAVLRMMDEKLDNNDVRLSLLEHWQSRSSGAIKAAIALGGSGFLITILKATGII